MDIEVLITTINDEQFAKLPQDLQDACRSSTAFQARQFLYDVAKGRQDEAEALFTANPDNTQTLLRSPGIFTDYSGRTFNCTAYEYAYWAKDTHMCRMLERHMDDETKAQLLERINIMEQTGLTYQQEGAEHHSVHFDFLLLKNAYERYLDGYKGWFEASKWQDLNAAWLDVGKAQRNVPAHIAQEYCRPNRAFAPPPSFNGELDTLPRGLACYNGNTDSIDSWYPLIASKSGLGFDFALIRSSYFRPVQENGRNPIIRRREILADLATITRLNEVSVAELAQSRERLYVPKASHTTCCSDSSQHRDAYFARPLGW